MRRFVAALLLLAFHASSLEAVAGVVRDGSVHHESVTQAATHAAEGRAEHGHEAVSDEPDEEHGPQHQHGTGSDHCTHAHGTALVGSVAGVALDAQLSWPTIVVAWSPSDFRAPPLFHPPRV
jgi:hypothetical protein